MYIYFNKAKAFLETFRGALLKPPTTDPPTTQHLSTDPPTAYSPTHRLTIMTIVKIEDQIVNLFCTSYFLKNFGFIDFLLLLSNYWVTIE